MAMTKEQKTALLSKVSLFSEVGPEALGEIADLMTEIEFTPGRYIVRQGQVGTGFYLIAGGRAKVVRGHADIARLGPGDFYLLVEGDGVSGAGPTDVTITLSDPIPAPPIDLCAGAVDLSFGGGNS